MMQFLSLFFLGDISMHFDNLCLFSDAQAEKFGNPKCSDCKDPGKSQQNAVKWNQIHRRIELCMREIIQFIKFDFCFLIVKFISVYRST
jgi:hypothetical protein